ncbi:MAG: class I SAM-dependent methyltransferase [Promethearchaeota archaeon]
MKKKDFFTITSQLDFPFLETNTALLKEIFEILKLKFGLLKNSKQKLIDLGSGNGQIIIYSALNYGIKSIGIEINKDLIKEAKTKIKSLKNQKSYSLRRLRKVKLIYGDLFKMSLKSFDYIYIFSLPTMQKYLRHIFLTIKRNSIIIAYKYSLESFEDIFELEYELKNEYKNQTISTYFYKKIR